MTIYIKITALIILIILIACKSENEQAKSEMQAAHGTQPLSGEISYQAPAGWIKESPSSPMRKDQYRLPGQAGNADAELAVFVFPGSGGSVQANIDRWINQFIQPDGSSSQEKAEIKKTSSDGLPVSLVYLTGTHLKGAMGGPMSGASEKLANYALLAAIVETSADPWFFKAVGPQATIDYWRPAFEKFIQSVSKK
jgi:hypothetical protein